MPVAAWRRDGESALTAGSATRLLRSVSLLGLAVLLTLLVPVGAHAQLSWQQPQTLSMPGENAQLPQVSMSPRGDGVTVCRGASTGLARGPRPGCAAPARTSVRHRPSRPPTAAATSRGRRWPVPEARSRSGATTMRRAGRWVHRSACGRCIRLAGVGFSLLPGERLVRGSDTPDVAIDPQGNGIAVWRPTDGRVRAAFRLAAGTWQPPPQTLAATGTAPDVAMDGGGNALAVWTETVQNGGSGGYTRIKAAFRPAGGSFGSAQTLTPLSRGSATHAEAPEVAFDGQGNALVVWVHTREPRQLLWCSVPPRRGQLRRADRVSASGLVQQRRDGHGRAGQRCRRLGSLQRAAI